MDNKQIAKILNSLKLLLNGGELTINRTTYVLSEDYCLCQKRYKTNPETKERTTIFLKVWQDGLNDFIKLTSTMPNEDFLNVAYYNVINTK